MAQVAVHIPFHRMEVPSADRYMDNPGWWQHRADILERFTLPSLAAQTDDNFDIVITMRDIDFSGHNSVVQIGQKHGVRFVLRPYVDWQYPVAPNHHSGFVDRYKGAHWLIVLHLDSDDCYASDVIELLRKEPLSPGLLLWFGFGWEYGVNDGKMCWYGSATGPPPFFAEVYDRQALSSAQEFGRYRREWGFECYHHQVVKAPNNRRMPDGKILQTIHGKNSSQTWRNPWVARRIKYWVEDEVEKARVLKLFGVQP